MGEKKQDKVKASEGRRGKGKEDVDGSWRELSEEALSGMKGWREQHPKAR